MIIRRTPVTEKQEFLSSAELICGLSGTSAQAAPDGTAASPAGTSIRPEDLLFFDIETTGLSADTSFLYLIGCLYLDEGEPVLSQFFSEGIGEEGLLIDEFDRLLASHPVPVHFNGATFDIPYLDKKRRRLGLPLQDMHGGGFDIFRTLKPYKALLGTGSMSQKRLELFCGIDRRDMYDGGRLIEVYNRYIAMRRLETLRKNADSIYIANTASGLTTAGPESSDELLELLFLHNFEDVLYMPRVASLLALPAFISGGYSIGSCEKTKEGELFITLLPKYDSADTALKGTHVCSCDPGSEIALRTEPGRFEFTVPVVTEELKLFYPDYKNYFYLPAEDSAIHKSLGSFLNSSYRTRCKADNCYTRHTLEFMPLAGELGKKDEFPFRIFKRYFSDKYGYVSAEEVLGSKEFLDIYIQRLVVNIR